MPEGSEPVEQLAAELEQLADAKAEAAGEEEAAEGEEITAGAAALTVQQAGDRGSMAKEGRESETILKLRRKQ